MAVNKIINGFFSRAGCGFPDASVAHIATALRGAARGAGRLWRHVRALK